MLFLAIYAYFLSACCVFDVPAISPFSLLALSPCRCCPLCFFLSHSHGDAVCRPPLAHNRWSHHHHEHQQHHSSPREPSPRWENGDTAADQRRLRVTPLSTVGGGLVGGGGDGDGGSSRGGGSGHRRSRRLAAHSGNRGGGRGGCISGAINDRRDDVDARNGGGNAGNGGDGGSNPRPWELNSLTRRGKTGWESERRRRGSRGDGDAAEWEEEEEEEDEEEVEVYRSRAAVATHTGEDRRRRGEPRGGEGRRPPSLSPSEGSRAPGRGPKRFRRDLDGGGGGAGRGHLVSSKGGTSNAAETNDETKTRP